MPSGMNYAQWKLENRKQIPIRGFLLRELVSTTYTAVLYNLDKLQFTSLMTEATLRVGLGQFQFYQPKFSGALIHVIVY